MTSNKKKIASLKIYLRRIISARNFAWAISIGMFVLLSYFLHKQYPRPIIFENMGQDIALITQILSIIMGVSLIGVTVHLSSYSLSDKLNSLLKEIELLAEPVFVKFFYGGKPKSKIDNAKFRKYLFNTVKIEHLIFRDHAKEYPDYYVFRPYWDGVWYQIYDSPFNEKVKDKFILSSIACMHELV
jgi:hypothetical protein